MENNDLIFKHEREIGELASIYKSIVNQQEKMLASMDAMSENLTKITILLNKQDEEIKKTIELYEELKELRQEIIELRYKSKELSEIKEQLKDIKSTLHPLAPLSSAINKVGNKAYYVILILILIIIAETLISGDGIISKMIQKIFSRM